MTVTITLVIPVGGDAGPFDLYSDANGYTIAFATNIDASTLVAGYTSNLVPNGTTIIRAISVGACTNFINISVNILPTTTTTTTGGKPTTTTSSSSTTTTTTTKPSCSIYELETTGPGSGGLECDWSGINCDTGLPVGATIPYPGTTSTGCIVDSSLVLGPKVIVLSSISCDGIVFGVDIPGCCDTLGREYIRLPIGTVIGSTVYATNGYCYTVISTSTSSPTITLGDPTIYGDCARCLADYPCPTTTTTTRI